MSHNFAIIILAAGQSKRFGKANKLLAELDGRAILQHVLDTVVTVSLKQKIVVSGHQAEMLSQSIEHAGFELVFNREYEEGMGSSIRKAAMQLKNNLDGVLILPGDMPRIEASAIRFLVDQWQIAADSNGIYTLSFEGKRGHPVLFGRSHFDGLKSLSGDSGARKLLKSNLSRVYEWPWQNPTILQDIDTGEALQAFCKMDSPPLL